MSERTEELKRRAEELATDIAAAKEVEDPDSTDYQLLDKALPMAITVSLLLYATTDVFKEQHT